MREEKKSSNHIIPVDANIVLPGLIDDAGSKAKFRFVEFFIAEIRNPGTRLAYGRAVRRFFTWCENRGLALEEISPLVVAGYVELLMKSLSKPTVKLHLAAIRTMFDYLVSGQILCVNPASSVRGPKYVVKKGKTPVLTQQETRQLLDSIPVNTISGLRDRALISVLFFGFARVTAAVGMNLEDYFSQGRRMWFRLHEKGGKLHDVPAHHIAEEMVDAYIDAAQIQGQQLSPLFRTISSNRTLSAIRMNRSDALRMIKRRARGAKLEARVCCHTFRASGITAYLLNDGLLEHAQLIAAHESIRTTKLYDHSGDEVSRDEIEKIRI